MASQITFALAKNRMAPQYGSTIFSIFILKPSDKLLIHCGLIKMAKWNFADDTIKSNFFRGSRCIVFSCSLRFVPKEPFHSKSMPVQCRTVTRTMDHTVNTYASLAMNGLKQLFNYLLCANYTSLVKISAHKPHDNNHWSLISLLLPRTAITSLVLWRHHTITYVDLWRHTNGWHWHCDIIFVDCTCTRKLAQSWYLLMNINQEYWYPAACVLFY